MKQWLAGIVGAILGGFLLFFAQGQYEKYSKSQENKVTVISDDRSFVIDQKLSKELQKATEGKYFNREARIYTFKIKNNGTQDISGKSFTIPVDDTISYGTFSSPNDNEKNVAISNDEKSVTVKYRLLPAGQEHSFWIATKDLMTSLQKFSADNPGMSVTNGDVDGDGFPWVILGFLGLGVVCFIIGGAVVQTMIGSELKARGIDLEATLKTPKP
jgi:hypothetical protein